MLARPLAEGLNWLAWVSAVQKRYCPLAAW